MKRRALRILDFRIVVAFIAGATANRYLGARAWHAPVWVDVSLYVLGAVAMIYGLWVLGRLVRLTRQMERERDGQG